MMKVFVVILTSVVVLSCVKPIHSEKIDLFGHAGAGLLNSKYKANTYESIEHALNNSVEGIEIDLQVTGDTVGVLYHDLEQIAGRYIHQYNFHELIEYKLTTLNQINPLIQNHDCKVIIDLKTDAMIMDIDQMVPLLQSVLQEFAEENDLNASRLYIVSRNSYLLSQIEVVGISKIYESNQFEEQLYSASINGFQGVLLKRSNLDLVKVKKIKQEGLIVGTLHSGTYNSLIRVFNMEPDFIILDDIKKANKLRAHGEK